VKDSPGFFVLLGEMKYELQAIWVKKAVQNLHISCGFSSDPKKTFRWMKDSTKSGRKHIQKMKSQTTTNQFQGVHHSLGQNNGGSYVVDTNIIKSSASAYYEPQVGLLTEAPLKVEKNTAQRRLSKKEIVI